MIGKTEPNIKHSFLSHRSTESAVRAPYHVFLLSVSGFSVVHIVRHRNEENMFALKQWCVCEHFTSRTSLKTTRRHYQRQQQLEVDRVKDRERKKELWKGSARTDECLCTYWTSKRTTKISRKSRRQAAKAEVESECRKNFAQVQVFIRFFVCFFIIHWRCGVCNRHFFGRFIPLHLRHSDHSELAKYSFHSIFSPLVFNGIGNHIARTHGVNSKINKIGSDNEDTNNGSRSRWWRWRRLEYEIKCTHFFRIIYSAKEIDELVSVWASAVFRRVNGCVYVCLFGG